MTEIINTFVFPDDDSDEHDVSDGLVAFYPGLDNLTREGLIDKVQVYDWALRPDIIRLLYMEGQ